MRSEQPWEESQLHQLNLGSCKLDLRRSCAHVVSNTLSVPFLLDYTRCGMTRTTIRTGPLTAATPLPLTSRIPAPLIIVCTDHEIEFRAHLPHSSRSSPLTLGFERPSTPTSDRSSPVNDPPEFVSRPRDLSEDDDDEEYAQKGNRTAVPRKKGGYDSRIEQILYENPDLQIIITDAGKSQESGGSYIVYTIRTGVRRSE